MDFEPLDLNEALSRCGLEPRLCPDDVPSNPWFYAMEYDAKHLCADMTQGKIRFTFNTSRQKQAYAIYSFGMVVVTAGMFDAICRTAAKLITKGIYTDIGEADEPVWQPSFPNSVASAGSLLDADAPFEWNEQRFPWIRDKERQTLFFYMMSCMFRFVVLHELGHLYHDHGNAEKRGKYHSMDVDEADAGGGRGGINAQARELVADKYAFDALQHVQQAELAAKRDTAVGRFLSEKVLISPEASLIFLLSIVYLYFYMMDRLDWRSADPLVATHPPAPFRLKTLLAMIYEFGAAGIDSANAAVVTAKAYYLSSMIVAVAFDQMPNPKWFEAMDDEQYQDLYRRIYDVLPIWTLTRPAE